MPVHPKLHFWLVSAVTDYDHRQSTKQGYNHYALSHYLEAAAYAETDVQRGQSVADAIKNNFIGSLQAFVLKWVEKNGGLNETLLGNYICQECSEKYDPSDSDARDTDAYCSHWCELQAHNMDSDERRSYVNESWGVCFECGAVLETSNDDYGDHYGGLCKKCLEKQHPIKEAEFTKSPTTYGGYGARSDRDIERAEQEIAWIEKKIASLQPQLAKRPSTIKQIRDLERQKRERELGIAFCDLKEDGPPTRWTAAKQYVKRVANVNKKLYAQACLDALQAGEELDDVDLPRDLSYLGAQSVRMELHSLINEDKFTDTLSKFTGMQFDACSKCGELLAHRGGKALPCTKCSPKAKQVSEGILDIFKKKPLEQGEVEYRCSNCFTKFKVKGHNNEPECPGCGNIDIETWDLIREDDETRSAVKHIEYNGKPAGQFKEFGFQGATKEHMRMAFDATRYMGAGELYDKLKRNSFSPAGKRVRVWKIEEGVLDHQAALSRLQKTWGVSIEDLDQNALAYEIKIARKLRQDFVLLYAKSSGKKIDISLEDAEALRKAWLSGIRGMKAYVAKRWDESVITQKDKHMLRNESASATRYVVVRVNGTLDARVVDTMTGRQIGDEIRDIDYRNGSARTIANARCAQLNRSYAAQLARKGNGRETGAISSVPWNEGTIIKHFGNIMLEVRDPNVNEGHGTPPKTFKKKNTTSNWKQADKKTTVKQYERDKRKVKG